MPVVVFGPVWGFLVGWTFWAMIVRVDRSLVFLLEAV